MRAGRVEIAIESAEIATHRAEAICPPSPSPVLSDLPAKILYCRCAFAQAVPEATKNAVLGRLCESGTSFESVADLCEMSARKDPRLAEILAGDEPIRIAACFPRAVKWLFHHAGAPLPDDGRVEVLNMRDTSADAIADALLAGAASPSSSNSPTP